MTQAPNPVTTLGRGQYRNGEAPFGIYESDRFMHLYMVGQTGTGKSTLLLNMALQDIQRGAGVALIDPHGDLAKAVTAHSRQSVICWDVADPASPYGYNPLTRTSKALRPLIASGLIDTLRKQWSDAWGVRMEHLLRHAILALLETPRTDLGDILRMFLDETFRTRVLAYVEDPQVKQFWVREYPAMNYKKSVDGLAPIANKLGAFMAHPLVRKAVCTPKTPLRFRQLMDSGGVLVVNLSKGRMGSDVANVLGGLLVAGITNAAFSRHDLPEKERRAFFLYIDEFHAFTTDSLADVLSETRKYRLGVVLSQQHIGQNNDRTVASILGNVGTILCFRVGAADAALLAAQLGHEAKQDLIHLPNHRAFVRMLIEGQPSKAFTMTTMAPPNL